MSGATRTQTILVRLVPAILLLGLAALNVHAYLEARELRHRKEVAFGTLGSVQRDNDQLVWAIQCRRKDPLCVERQAADEHLVAREGARLYVFEGDTLVGQR